MDGLNDTPPYGIPNDEVVQMSLFEEDETTDDEIIYCKIYDWRADISKLFKGLKKRGKGMKFDFVIGNPPYQDNTLGDNETYAPPIYHSFMDAAYAVADRVELITPARFLFDAGSTPKSWNKRMLSNPHIKILFYESDTKKVFPSAFITGGVAVSYYDAQSDFGAIGVFTPILHKTVSHPSFEGMDSIVISRTAYRFTDVMHQEHPEAISQLSNGHAYDMSSNIFERLPQVFFDEVPNDNRPYIRIFGKIGNTRVYKFVRADYVREVSNLHKYKIVMARADGASGTIGNPIPARIMGNPHLEEPHTGNTETFLSIGSFDNKELGENALKYVKSKLARTLLSVLKTTQDITPDKWKYVPLQDFTSNSDIDWSKPIAEIDKQLYKKYGLTPDEIKFIETHVKEME